MNTYRSKYPDHIVAFARHHEGRVAITVAPRLYTQFMNISGGLLPATDVWKDTRIDVSCLSAVKYRNPLTDETLSVGEKDDGVFLLAEELLKNFPVALLAGDQPGD